MTKKINKKKIVGICHAGINKTACPSIGKTRHIRIKLLALQRQKDFDIKKVMKLRAELKERKNQGIAADCESCGFNTSGKTPATAIQ